MLFEKNEGHSGQVECVTSNPQLSWTRKKKRRPKWFAKFTTNNCVKNPEVSFSVTDFLVSISENIAPTINLKLLL